MTAASTWWPMRASSSARLRSVTHWRCASPRSRQCRIASWNPATALAGSPWRARIEDSVTHATDRCRWVDGLFQQCLGSERIELGEDLRLRVVDVGHRGGRTGDDGCSAGIVDPPERAVDVAVVAQGKRGEHVSDGGDVVIAGGLGVAGGPRTCPAGVPEPSRRQFDIREYQIGEPAHRVPVRDLARRGRGLERAVDVTRLERGQRSRRAEPGLESNATSSALRARRTSALRSSSLTAAGRTIGCSARSPNAGPRHAPSHADGSPPRATASGATARR
jgi:hypothetical protein